MKAASLSRDAGAEEEGAVVAVAVVVDEAVAAGVDAPAAAACRAHRAAVVEGCHVRPEEEAEVVEGCHAHPEVEAVVVGVGCHGHPEAAVAGVSPARLAAEEIFRARPAEEERRVRRSFHPVAAHGPAAVACLRRLPLAQRVATGLQARTGLQAVAEWPPNCLPATVRADLNVPRNNLPVPVVAAWLIDQRVAMRAARHNFRRGRGAAWRIVLATETQVVLLNFPIARAAAPPIAQEPGQASDRAMAISATSLALPEAPREQGRSPRSCPREQSGRASAIARAHSP